MMSIQLAYVQFLFFITSTDARNMAFVGWYLPALQLYAYEITGIS